MERRLALCAMRLGKNVNIQPKSRLVREEHFNPHIWADSIGQAKVSSTKPAKEYISNDRELKELFKYPIIIGGCGRSGTTLLLSVLSCHPEIYCIGDETACLCPTGYNRVVDYTNTLRVDLLYKYLSEKNIPIQSKYWCEKTPKNVLFFANILAYFGKKAKLIHLVRDPRDVITSTHPRKPNNYYVPIQRWVDDVKEGRNFYYHENILTLRYEDLLLDYTNQIKKICSFIELEYDKRFEDYPETAALEGKAKKIGGFDPKRGISTTSIGKWKDDKHTDRINQLMQNQEAVELMKFFGYLS